MNLPRIENLEVKSKRVFVRVDLDVPLDLGKIKSTTKFLKILPTLEFLLSKGAKVIVASHLGEQGSKLSLKPVALKLKELLGREVEFLESLNPIDWETKSKSMQSGQIVFLENLNFFPEEHKNDPNFSLLLAKTADFYVNDAFSLGHKTLASTVGITKYLEAYPGTLMQREIDTFYNMLSNPEKPFVAIIGGSRVSTKLKILNNLLSKANTILIGGGMAYTFLKARAVPIGASVVEKDYEVLAHQFIDKAGLAGVDFHMPIDHIIANTMSARAKSKQVERMGILDGWIGMDIGSKTIQAYQKVIKSAGTIFWSGPMGVVEYEPFSQGSIQIAKSIAKSNAKSIIGGNDTASLIYKIGLEEKMTHLSTGDGACVQLLEGKLLPGIQVLVKEKED